MFNLAVFKKPKKYLPNFILLLCSVIFSLFSLEIVLRLYFYQSITNPDYSSANGLREPHPTRGWTLVPDKMAFLHTLDYSVNVKINSKGLRDVEHDYTPHKDAFRIVVLGDSFMEAYQVDLEKSLPRLLDKKLKDRNVEVINLGVGGYGTTQEYLYLLEEGLKYKPDLVLLAFLPVNDIRNNSLLLEKILWGNNTIKTFGRPYAYIDEKNDQLLISKPDFERIKKWTSMMRNKMKEREAELSFLKRTLSYKLINNFLNSLKSNESTLPKYNVNALYGPIMEHFEPSLSRQPLSVGEYEKLWEDAWNITCKVIHATKALSKNNNANFIVFTVPAKIQSDPNWFELVSKQHPSVKFNLTKINKKLLEFGLENDIIVFDILPYFVHAYQENKGTLFHAISDRHWNATGHELVSDIIIELLDSKHLLPNKNPK